MSPYEHGEVFVCDDGCEADLDLGNYERFLDVKLGRENNITTGKIYQSVIERERAGAYNGHTVQIVPHVTNCIIEWIERVAEKDIDEYGKADICLIEVGGTVGDIESAVFLEAIRQLIQSKPKEDICLGFVSLVPLIGELKTKPTQHGVATLRSVGLFPDILCLRCPVELDEKTKAKISLFTNVPTENCFSLHDCPIIFGVPSMLNSQHAAQIILKKFNLEPRKEIDLKEWNRITSIIGDDSLEELRVAFVGKYTKIEDSYLSVRKALLHASIAIKRRLTIDFIESSDLEKVKEKIDGEKEESKEESNRKYNEAWTKLKSAHCLLVPGGFGERGIEGKIAAIKYARENKVPFLGICLGMQLAVIEYARNILKKTKANSTEFDESTRDPVVVFMPEIDPTIIGGTMRLGGKDTTLLTKDCICYNLYHKPKNMSIYIIYIYIKYSYKRKTSS